MNTFRLSGSVVSNEEALYAEILGLDCISSNQVDNFLKQANGDDVTFNLTTGGGSVFTGTEIYTMLKMYSGHVTINVTSLSASIGTVIMLGADTLNISESAQIMIHKPSSVAMGDSIDLQRALNMLSASEKTIINLYNKKTGIEKEELAEMMFNETWLTADEALDKGFVDNIIGDDSSDVNVLEAVASLDNQLEDIKALRDLINQIKKPHMEDNMDKEKSILDKLKNLLNSTEETTKEDVVEETVEMAKPEEADITTEEVVEESVEEVEEQQESTPVEETEIVVDVNDKLVNTLSDKLEEAITSIETLKAENESLKKENEKLSAKNSASEEFKNKATDLVEKLNNALSEKQNVAVVYNSDKEKPKSLYKGFRNIGG